MATCMCSSNPCRCKSKSLDEHLNRIKYVSAYVLNEAKYNLIQDMDEDDTVPEEVWSTQPVSGNDSNVHEDGDSTKKEPVAGAEQAPETDVPAMPEDQIATGQEPAATTPDLNSAVPPVEPSPVEPQKSADEIQNEIIKTSVAAMQKMHQEMDKLNMSVDAINAKIGELHKDVDAVKEPTNVEKLTARKQDSHPFYYNLNDMWKDNWFQARRMEDKSSGIVELEDGSYVADFDTLPKYNDREIKDSFNV